MKPAGSKWWAGLGAALALQACSAPVETSTDPADPAAATSTWGRPPEIETAALRGDALVVRGRAQPSARVVFRHTDGDAHAVVADTRGRFVLPITLSDDTTLIRLEIQRGQERAPSPDRLLVSRDGGLVAVLRPGRPTRRLSPGPLLDAVDVSGGSALLTGRASRPVTVTVGGRRETITPSGGRWSRLASTSDLTSIEVDARAFRWPGSGASTGMAARIDGGWRIDWSDDAGARQTTWLPDA